MIRPCEIVRLLFCVMNIQQSFGNETEDKALLNRCKEKSDSCVLYTVPLFYSTTFSVLLALMIHLQVEHIHFNGEHHWIHTMLNNLVHCVEKKLSKVHLQRNESVHCTACSQSYGNRITHNQVLLLVLFLCKLQSAFLMAILVFAVIIINVEEFKVVPLCFRKVINYYFFVDLPPHCYQINDLP